MGKALPDDMPLEAKMVSKAIERAQTTVEQKNGEIRKNVLKYDEVLNEQRKVIYALRDQILDKARPARAHRQRAPAGRDPDPRRHVLRRRLPRGVGRHGAARRRAHVLASTLTVEELASRHSTKELFELLRDDGVSHYEAREEELGAAVLRQVERQVMLRIIDTRWREHLYEMDYLQEGINLRAMGQRDPLTEWQREGFEMFGQMMQGIAQDLVRYVMHVQVQVSEPAKAQAAAAAEAAKKAEELAAAPKESARLGRQGASQRPRRLKPPSRQRTRPQSPAPEEPAAEEEPSRGRGGRRARDRGAGRGGEARGSSIERRSRGASPPRSPSPRSPSPKSPQRPRSPTPEEPAGVRAGTGARA